RTNPSTAAADLINGWYKHGQGSITTGGQTVDDNFAPLGWTTPPPPPAASALYADVVKTSCRTCHVNRDHPLEWAEFNRTSLFVVPANAGFRQNGVTINPAVCGVRSMPHAKVTYINFWMHSSAASVPNRANELRTAGLNGFPATALCPSP